MAESDLLNADPELIPLMQEVLTRLQEKRRNRPYSRANIVGRDELIYPANLPQMTRQEQEKLRDEYIKAVDFMVQVGDLEIVNSDTISLQKSAYFCDSYTQRIAKLKQKQREEGEEKERDIQYQKDISRMAEALKGLESMEGELKDLRIKVNKLTIDKTENELNPPKSEKRRKRISFWGQLLGNLGSGIAGGVAVWALMSTKSDKPQPIQKQQYESHTEKTQNPPPPTNLDSIPNVLKY